MEKEIVLEMASLPQNDVIYGNFHEYFLQIIYYDLI